MRLTFKYRINSERIEIKIERAGQKEIFRNQRTLFGGVPHFLLQATDITVPFAQHFHFHLICYLFAYKGREIGLRDSHLRLFSLV